MGIFKKKEIDVRRIRKYKSFKDYLFAYKREVREAFIVPEVYECTGTTLDDFMRSDICLKKQLTYEEAVDCVFLLTAQINLSILVQLELGKKYDELFEKKINRFKSIKNFSSVNLIDYDEVNINMVLKTIKEKRAAVNIAWGKEIIEKDFEVPKTLEDCINEINKDLAFVAGEGTDRILTYASIIADTQILSLKYSVLNDTLADMAKKRNKTT